MNEILALLTPADVVEKLVLLRLDLKDATDPEDRADLTQRLSQLQRTVDQILPIDDRQIALSHELSENHADLRAIEADMRACEERKDFGSAFVGLSRAYLAMRDQRDATRAAISSHLNKIIAEI